MTKKKKKILSLCLMVAVVADDLIWQQFFHCKTLIEGQTAYEPGFFYQSPSGREEFRRIQQNRLVKEDSAYQSGYRGSYPAAAEQRLHQAGYGQDCGQLLFYHHYPVGRLYAYSGGSAPVWPVFLETPQGVRQFQVEKSSQGEKMTDCTSDGRFVYLHLTTSQDEAVILRLEIETGQQKRDAVSFRQLGLEPGPYRFDARTGQLICWIFSGGQYELLFYSFEKEEKRIMHLNQPAEQLIALEGGYATILPKYGGRVFFYFYDMDWRPIPEKETYVDLVESDAMLMPLSRDIHDGAVELVDGIVYGCIEGEEALWYYAIDLEARQPVALWEVRHPRGTLELWDHLLFHKETGCEPYPTLF